MFAWWVTVGFCLQAEHFLGATKTEFSEIRRLVRKIEAAPETSAEPKTPAGPTATVTTVTGSSGATP